MGRNMEIHQIIQTGQAGSSLHPVTDLECLKMQKTGLEKAMRRLGVLGKSIDDLRPRESLGSQLECDSGCVRQRCTWGLPCAHSHAFSSLSPLLSSVSLRKVEPMICWWVIWRPSQALEVKHVQPPVPFSSVQSLSRVRLCDPMNRSTPGLPVHHQLLEFTQTHIHRVSDAIQPSHPLWSPSPAPNLSQHQSLFQ